MSLSQTVVTARNKKGLTQEELASMANVTVRTIQRIESGETIPRAYTLKAIAAALGVSFEELKNGAGQAPVASNPGNRAAAVHFLQLLCLSCFSYLIIPCIHFFLPMYILKKRREDDPGVLAYGRWVIRNQVYWVVALVLLLLLTLAFNILSTVYFNRAYLVSYLVPFFVMYFLNAMIISIAIIRAKRVQVIS